MVRLEPGDAAADETSAKRASLWRAPLLVLALALVVTALLLSFVLRSVAARERSAFEAEASRTADAVQERIDTTVTLLHGTAGLFAASRDVAREEFAAYAGNLQLRERYQGVQGIGYTVRLLPDEREPVLRRLRADGLPGLRVWPEGEREEYHSIVYLEPRDARNMAAMGYDMFTEPTRREAMARARDEGRPAATGKVVLVQEIDERKQAGFLIYLPVYRSGTDPRDVAARRRALAGFVYAPMRVGDLLRGVLGEDSEVAFALYDGLRADPEALLSASAPGGSAEPAYRTERQVQVAGRRWLLQMASRPDFAPLPQRRLLPLLVLAALAGSGLLAWITFVQVRARRDAELAAAQRRRNELALQASEERERERARRLQELYAELRDADRRKDEFLAVLAHELRNPLAPLRTALEIIRRAPDGAGAARAREVAERQVQHMVRLIDDLLDVSRISRGKISLQRRPTPVAEVVQAAVETSRPLLESRGHRLEVAPVDPTLQLDIDATRIAQVLTNLLNNAAQYTPPGGEVALQVREEGGTVRLAVQDNGIGLDAEDLRRVFGLFVQVNRGGGGGGLGIGLSLAARLAELHGGHIEAHSEGPGRGSAFVLVLPATAAGQLESRPRPTSKSEKGNPVMTPRTPSEGSTAP